MAPADVIAIKTDDDVKEMLSELRKAISRTMPIKTRLAARRLAPLQVFVLVDLDPKSYSGLLLEVHDLQLPQSADSREGQTLNLGSRLATLAVNQVLGQFRRPIPYFDVVALGMERHRATPASWLRRCKGLHDGLMAVNKIIQGWSESCDYEWLFRHIASLAKRVLVTDPSHLAIWPLRALAYSEFYKEARGPSQFKRHLDIFLQLRW
jgi:hypothetical protein